MCMNFYFLETWRKNYCLCNVSVSSYFVVLATKNIFPCTCIDIKKAWRYMYPLCVLFCYIIMTLLEVGLDFPRIRRSSFFWLKFILVNLQHNMCKYAYFVFFDLQIAGLTNNSYLAESHEVRHCVMKHEALGEYVLEVAKVLSQVHLFVLHISW